MRNYVIFDLDGTLVDSGAICVAILQEMLDERDAGVTIDRATANAYMSCGGPRMVSALLGDACGNVEHELRSFRARYADRITPRESLFAGVPEGIARLRRAGFELAICSNKPQNLCRKVLADTGLLPHFAVIAGLRDDVRPKPYPDLLDAALAGLGTDADACVFVGDSELDHEIADAARMPFCFMRYGYATPGWQPAGPLCFDEFATLVHMLVAVGPAASWADRVVPPLPPLAPAPPLVAATRPRRAVAR